MGHIHAAAMVEYAKDAAETDKPWERWEVSFSGGFIGVTGHPNWSVNHEYRRKPKTILINGHEVPEPCRTPLQNGVYYWVPNIFVGAVSYCWHDDDKDNSCLRDGFVRLTSEAAEKHLNALKSFTAKGDQ